MKVKRTCPICSLPLGDAYRMVAVDGAVCRNVYVHPECLAAHPVPWTAAYAAQMIGGAEVVPCKEKKVKVPRQEVLF